MQRGLKSGGQRKLPAGFSPLVSISEFAPRQLAARAEVTVKLARMLKMVVFIN